MNNKPNVTSTTGVRYLNIDYQKKFGNNYVVRVNIVGKNFIIWKGKDFDVGKKVAEKVQELISKSISDFVYWYDYEREEWLLYHGYNKDANNKRPK